MRFTFFKLRNWVIAGAIIGAINLADGSGKTSSPSTNSSEELRRLGSSMRELVDAYPILADSAVMSIAVGVVFLLLVGGAILLNRKAEEHIADRNW